MMNRTPQRLALILTVIAAVGGLGVPLGFAPLAPASAEAAELIVDKPFTGPRRLVELNLHLSTYYGYGWIGLNDFGGLGYGGLAVGVGADVLIPVVRNGFIPRLNNAFYIGIFIEPLFHLGANFSGNFGYLSLPVGAFAQWRFNLLKMFDGGGLSVFANLGFGVWPWFTNSFGNCTGCSTYITAFPLFQVGGLLQFTQRIGLRLAFGYPSTNVGLTIAF